MNFEDEPYVRLFTRRTLTNRLVGWEGRAVMHEMLYEFDRAGVFEFDGDLADAVTVMTGLPPEVVTAGLPRILKSGTWVVRGGFLVWPNFLEAQTCYRSDASRQKESRERRRAAAHASEVLGDDAPKESVTPCDIPSRHVTDPSRGVTVSHSQSQSVTLSLAQPSLAILDPDSASQDSAGTEPVGVAPAVDRPKRRSRKPAEPAEAPDPRVVQLRDIYVEEFRKAKGTEPLLGKQWSRAMREFKNLLAATKDLETATDIVRRALADPWHRENRCQPWEVVADANKLIGAKVGQQRPAPETRVERMTREQLERVATLEEQERKAAMGQ